MLRRYAFAPVQGLVLFGLSMVGLAQLAVVVVGSFTGVTVHYQLARWLPNLCRRLVHAWLGLAIPQPYQPKPPLPAREPGGLYRWGDQLYKRKGLVRYRQRSEWLNGDPATHRDHLWALLTPLTGGLAAGLSGGLIILGFLRPVWAAIPLVIGGFAIGPWMLDLYGRWTSSLLGPSGRTGRHPFLAWVMRRTLAVMQLSLTLGLSLLCLPYAAMNLLSLYPGILAPLPFAVRVTRPLVTTRRAQIRRWSGVEIAEPYMPPPPPPVLRPDGKYQAGKRLYDSPRRLGLPG